MKKIFKGIIFGLIAGTIDVTPMIIQKLPLEANLSAFSMWVIIGFIISTSNLHLHKILKGILISLMILTPVGIIIAHQQPMSLIPICIMTLILGSLLGYFI